MRVFVSVLVLFICVGLAQAGPIITFQDATPNGSDPGIGDAELRYPVPANPSEADMNFGVSPDCRIYPDGATYAQPDTYGPRHITFQFDVSPLNGAGIVSAKLGFYIHPYNSSKSAVAYHDMKLSAFLPGKDWFEGTGDSAPALPGEVTWNSQKHNLSPAWALAGGTGPNTDIDIPSTKTFSFAASAINGEVRNVELDVTDFVQAWTSGIDNNGMIIWGGTTDVSMTARNQWQVWMSEYLGGGTFYLPDGTPVTTDITFRPYLKVEIPEPVTMLLLGVGLIPTLRRRR